ncbi:MAG: hypothetical protein M1835_007339 [Candelina submexicana]|nr:MAG: hypothetical protein M1835_007339 [Candelina submexicana]
MDNREPSGPPGGLVPEFGPPGSGRPPSSQQKQSGTDNNNTHSSHEITNLVSSSSLVLPQTPTRPPRNSPRDEGNASLGMQSVGILPPLKGQGSMQAPISRNPARFTANPDQSSQQSPSDMAGNKEVAASSNDQSLLAQLTEAYQKIGKAKEVQAHEHRRAERYKSELGKTTDKLQKRIVDLEDLLEKAQRTIQVQSNQLSGKTEQVPQTPQRQRALQPQATPFIATPAHQVYSYVVDQHAPPILNTQPTRGPMPYHPPTLQRQGTSNVSSTTHFGHPGVSRFPSGDVFTSAAQSSYPAAPQVAPPTQGTYDATAVVPYAQSELPKKDFKTAFVEFFADIESWAQKWASVPNPRMDENLPESLKALLSSVCDKSIALHLLRDPTTRYFLVARVINDEFTKHQLKITSIMGFSLTLDMRIQKAKDELRPDNHINFRRAIVEELANIAQAANADPKHQEFLVERCQQMTMEMMNKLSPLMGTGLNRAYADLHDIQKKALLLAMNMLTGPFEWKIDYPLINALYVPHSMVNRDPVIAGEPHMLARTRVKLAVTPIIIRRDQSGPSVIATQEHMANVLLMK